MLLYAGTFKLTLEFSEEYPNKAPVVKFVSNIFHPNGVRPLQRHLPLTDPVSAFHQMF